MTALVPTLSMIHHARSPRATCKEGDLKVPEQRHHWPTQCLHGHRYGHCLNDNDESEDNNVAEKPMQVCRSRVRFTNGD